MRVFVLEDDPGRHRGFREALYESNADLTIVEDVKTAKAAFVPPYDIICLDHDLGGEIFVDSSEENTGFQFVRWLCMDAAPDMRTTPIFVHSYNPEGASRMYRMLLSSGYTAYRMPYGPNLLRALKAICNNS